MATNTVINFVKRFYLIPTTAIGTVIGGIAAGGNDEPAYIIYGALAGASYPISVPMLLAYKLGEHIRELEDNGYRLRWCNERITSWRSAKPTGFNMSSKSSLSTNSSTSFRFDLR